MQRAIGVIGIAVIVGSALKFGLAAALGTALGVALSWHNFRWLTQAVNAWASASRPGKAASAEASSSSALPSVSFGSAGFVCYIQIFSKGPLRLPGWSVRARSRPALRGCLRGIWRLPAWTVSQIWRHFGSVKVVCPKDTYPNGTITSFYCASEPALCGSRHWTAAHVGNSRQTPARAHSKLRGDADPGYPLACDALSHRALANLKWKSRAASST